MKFYYEFYGPGHFRLQIKIGDDIYTIAHSNVSIFSGVSISAYIPSDPTLPFDEKGYEKAIKENGGICKKIDENRSTSVYTDIEIEYPEISAERAIKALEKIISGTDKNHKCYKQLTSLMESIKNEN